MVVISGLAIIAGSILNIFAIIGRIPPAIFANITVKNKVMHTVTDINKSVFPK